jgi:hypothetical protein
MELFLSILDSSRFLWAPSRPGDFFMVYFTLTQRASVYLPVIYSRVCAVRLYTDTRLRDTYANQTDARARVVLSLSPETPNDRLFLLLLT